MTESDARKICEEDGFSVIELIEEIDGCFRFLCAGDPGEDDVVVFVCNGYADVEPT